MYQNQFQVAIFHYFDPDRIVLEKAKNRRNRYLIVFIIKSLTIINKDHNISSINYFKLIKKLFYKN